VPQHELEDRRGEEVRAWATVAANSFGGPVAQIAVMHREIVTKRGWIDEDSFRHGLNFCMFLPGPEAQQLAVYLGWLRDGIRGGLLAGGLFILPGLAAILALSVVYVTWGSVDWVEGAFRGIGPALVAIVAHAAWRLGRRTLHGPGARLVAAAAFIGMFFFAVPFPAIVAGALLLGLVSGRRRREEPQAPSSGSTPIRPRSRTLLVVVVGLSLWLGPVVAIVSTLGRTSVWSDISLLFSQAAVVTFGGAYSVLAYVAQQAVEVHGWLTPPEMLHGLALAETTPGPLIQVVQFVGFLAGYRHSGSLSPMAGGVVGSLLTVWVTFVPSFLWILAAAPYVQRLRAYPQLSHALATITAAVVGVMLNLAVWFALFGLFASVETRFVAGGRLYLPDPATLDPVGVGIAVAAAVALFRFGRPIIQIIVAAGAIGALRSTLG
jgi:chromate transporter